MLGERLSDLRKNKNMTQEEFADYMGVTRQSVSKWEMNKAYPDIEKIIRICELYDVSVDYLLRGEESQVADASQEQETQNLNEQQESECLKSQHISHNSNEYQEANDFEEIQMVTDATLDDSFVEETQAKAKCRRPLWICFGISAVVSLCIIVVMAVILIQSAWFQPESNKTAVRIENVLEQVSVAEVSVTMEDGSSVKETVLLDKNNIRQGDYIYAYVDGNNVLVEYSTYTIIILLVAMIISLTMVILLKKELADK